MHGGGLLLVLSLQIFIGDGEHPREVCDLHPATILDALETRERCGTRGRIRVLDQKRDLPVAAVRDQRVVGFELLDDALGLEDLFGTQDLLHLILDGETVFKEPRGVRAYTELAYLFMGHDTRAELRALTGIALEGHQVGGGELLHVQIP